MNLLKGGLLSNMSKLYFYYGVMSSNKSGSLLSNAYTYEKQGKNVLLLKPTFDSRSKEGFIESRSGIPPRKAIEFTKDDDLFTIIRKYQKDNNIELDCILIDEIHFATREQIKQLVNVVDKLDLNVITYGLKNSYIDGQIFNSIQELIYQCNNMYEIKSTCHFCNSKATHHLRIVNGDIVRSGEENIVGDVVGEDKYISVCRKHYYNPKF